MKIFDSSASVEGNDSYRRVLRHKSSERLAALVARLIVSQIDDCSSVLDIGCGDGRLGEELLGDIEYRGLDINDACIYEQSSNPSITYTNSEDVAKRIGELHKYCDTAVMLDILEHTKTFEGLAIECAQAKYSNIVISLPNELFIYNRIRFAMGVELPAHALDLRVLPDGFKHQYIINIERAKKILVDALTGYGYELEVEYQRELIPSKILLRPLMKALKRVTSPAVWSTGTIFVFRLKE